MANDITELYERLECCRDDATVLSGEARCFFSENIVERKQKVNNGNFYDLFATQIAPIPTRLRYKAGQITNEIRSCLDALAYQLAIRNMKECNKVYFPISKSKEIFLNEGMKSIRYLSSSDQITIQDLQPFQGGHPHLFLLHEADRTRKHQRLATAAMQFKSANVGNFFSITGGGGLIIENLSINDVSYGQFELNPSPLFLSNIGEEYSIARGIPMFLNTNIQYNLKFLEPNALNGVNVEEFLTNSINAVASILQKFE